MPACLILFLLLCGPISTLFLVCAGGRSLGSKPAASPDAWDFPVIGDGFRIEFYNDMLGSLKSEYALNALHNTVQAWIDYRDWMRYPDEWGNIARLIGYAHQNALPVGVVFGYHVSDSVDAKYADAVGFLYYYQNVLPNEQRWRFPNGTIASDPYSVGLSRTFSDACAMRILGEELGRRDFLSVMQPQNPYWQSFFVNWAKTAIDNGADAIWLDSPDTMFVYNWGGGWGGADTWEGLGFINYLKSRHTQSQLNSLGITSINSFCLRDYLKQRYQFNGVSGNYLYARERFRVPWPIETANFADPNAVMHDPLMREAVVYWYGSMVNFTRDSMQQIKAYAASIGKNVLLASNEYFASPKVLTLTPYMDRIYVETNQFSPPPYQTNPAICKLAEASGNFSKKVWIGEMMLWFSNPFSPANPPSDISNLLKLKIAETYADGCTMLVPFGTGSPANGWPPNRLVLGSERGPVSKFYQFISSQKDILTNAQPYSNVALIASLPTQMWNYLPALGVNWQDENEAFGWGRALESMHIPYDMLLLGVKGLLSTDSISRLPNYDLIIAPGLTNISDKDLDAIRAYLNGNGKLTVSSDFAASDEFNRPRDPNAISDILTNRGTTVVRTGVGRTYVASLQARNPDISTLLYMQSAITARNPSRLITADAPQNVFVNTLIQANGRILVHLVNYDYSYDHTTDWTNPKGPVSIDLTLPNNNPIMDVRLLSPDNPTSTVQLGFTQTGNHLSLVASSLRTWSIITVNPDTGKGTSRIVLDASPKSGYVSKPVTISGVMYGSWRCIRDGMAVGKPVYVTTGWGFSTVVTTDYYGQFSVITNCPSTGGTYPITATFYEDQDLLGNSTTIQYEVIAKIPTTIAISYVANRQFEGYLRRADTGAYLAYKPVKLTVRYLSGATWQTATYNLQTRHDGCWTLEFLFYWNSATISFEGDETYASSSATITR